MRPGSVSDLVTRAPEATTQSGARLVRSLNVELTPRKLLDPMLQKPEIATCEATKQLFSMTVRWPTWFPLHMMTLLPMVTNGWIVLCSKMKLFSPTRAFFQTNARVLT